MNLQGKTALVTGGSRGIGRAIALRLAHDGATVIVHFKNNQEAAQEVVDSITNLGGRAIAIRADLANVSEIENLWAEFDRRGADLDILVNNAGWATFAASESVIKEDYDAVFNLNVRGLFFHTQQAMKRIRLNGRIINISSGITRVNAPNGAVYAASKAAVEAFTRSWAAELGPRGITVNTVSPGMTQTDLLMSVTPQNVLDDMIRQTPLGRLGQPDDVADVVAFLCSDDARWITANNLLANGGVG